jgi:alpha-beta hydrolase superfamily lysophospholipase
MPPEQLLHFSSDGLNLVGSLHLPDQPRAPVVIGCHGLMADRGSPKQVALAMACNRQGLAYFRFDHRGCGGSQGDFKTVTTLHARCRDLKSAMAKMQQHPAVGPIAALFGSSFGGTVVLALASQITAPALITYAAPVSSAAIRKTSIKDSAGRPVSDQRLPPDLAFDLTDRLDDVGHILVAHGELDEIVPAAHARAIYQKARKPKRLLIQKGGDHRMSDPVHQREFEKHFLSWIQSAMQSEQMS